MAGADDAVDAPEVPKKLRAGLFVLYSENVKGCDKTLCGAGATDRGEPPISNPNRLSWVGVFRSDDEGFAVWMKTIRGFPNRFGVGTPKPIRC